MNWAFIALPAGEVAAMEFQLETEMVNELLKVMESSKNFVREKRAVYGAYFFRWRITQRVRGRSGPYVNVSRAKV